MIKIEKNQLRVWHVPQIPMGAFYVNVKNWQEAIVVLDTLGSYDLFQLENKIKPDYCNANGLQVFDGKEWIEYSDDYGRDIEEIRKDRVLMTNEDD